MADGLGKSGRPPPLVTVQASHALEDQVDGSEVSDEQVEVDVEGLLDDLGGDDDGSARALSSLARRTEAVEKILVLGEPVADREPGVVETDVLAEVLAQPLIGIRTVLRRPDAVGTTSVRSSLAVTRQGKGVCTFSGAGRRRTRLPATRRRPRR